MEIIHVRLAGASCPIVIGSPLYNMASFLKRLQKTQGKALIVTHPSLKAKFGTSLARSLASSRAGCAFALMPEGEGKELIVSLCTGHDVQSGRSAARNALGSNG